MLLSTPSTPSTPSSRPNHAAPARTLALPLPVSRRAAVLTCMHGTLDCGLLLGPCAQELPIIRNPGARVTEDAVRSLLLAHEVLGARRFYIVQHSDCGMALLSDEITENLWSAADRATLHDRAGSARHARLGRLLSQERCQILAADVMRLRAHPRLPAAVSVHGYYLDLGSGQLHEVARE